jgi:hypothetical protein
MGVKCYTIVRVNMSQRYCISAVLVAGLWSVGQYPFGT